VENVETNARAILLTYFLGYSRCVQCQQGIGRQGATTAT
jgi:hypothetical protein